MRIDPSCVLDGSTYVQFVPPGFLGGRGEAFSTAVEIGFYESGNKSFVRIL